MARRQGYMLAFLSTFVTASYLHGLLLGISALMIFFVCGMLTGYMKTTYPLTNR